MKSIIFNQHQVNYALRNKEGMFRVVVNTKQSFIEPSQPYGKLPFEVGETIFVKETFATSLGSLQIEDVKYSADQQNLYGFIGREDWRNRPAQHMKQEHSRLTLRIKSVKVERLQDISEEDCLREGVYKSEKPNPFSGRNYRAFECNNFLEPERSWHYTAQRAFAELWNSTHKKPEEKWEASPWVFAYSYEVIKK